MEKHQNFSIRYVLIGAGSFLAELSGYFSVIFSNTSILEKILKIYGHYFCCDVTFFRFMGMLLMPKAE